jgi:hypothetical protein
MYRPAIQTGMNPGNLASDTDAGKGSENLQKPSQQSRPAPYRRTLGASAHRSR